MYTASPKPQAPRRRRAVIAAVIVLGLTTGLAAMLVSSRQAVCLVGDRIAPPGWPVSFQPPAGWSEVVRRADYLEFRDDRDRRNHRQFAIYLESNSSGLPAAEMAARVMAGHLLRAVGPAPPPPSEDGVLGSLPGALVNMPYTGDYVHVGLLPPDQAQAVVLRYHTAAAFTERDVRTCRRVVESVQIAGQR